MDDNEARSSILQQKQQINDQVQAAMVNQNVEYQPGHVIDYKAKINLFIEMEKLKLLTKAMAAGIAE